MADLTPIQEYNKALKDSAREVQEASKGLKTPFKQLVGEIKSVNTEFAKVIADNVSQTQDSFKGLITERRKRKVIDELETKEFKRASKANIESRNKDARLKQKFFEEERRLIEERQKIIRKDTQSKDKGSLGELKKEQAEQQKAFNKATADEQVAISENLNNIAQSIQQRETALTTVNKDELSRKEEQLENDLKFNKEKRNKDEILVNETNQKLEERLKDASNTENYDKFTGGIKTLSGGLIDIEGVLDPFAEKVGALRDVFSSMGSVVTKAWGGLGTMGEKMFGEDAQEDAEKTKKGQEELNEETEKAKGGFKGLFKNMKFSITGLLALGAIVMALVAIMKLASKSPFWSKLNPFAEPTPDPKGVETERNYDTVKNELQELMKGEDGKQDMSKINDPEVQAKLAEMKKYRDEMEQKKKDEGDENLFGLMGVGNEGYDGEIFGMDYSLPHYEAPVTANLSAYGQQWGANARGLSNWGGAKIQSGFGMTPTTSSGAPDMRFNVNKLANNSLDLAQSQQRNLTRASGWANKFVKGGSLVTLPLTIYLTEDEVQRNLSQSDDIEKTINMMDESHEDHDPSMTAHPDDIAALRAALADKKMQDKRKPRWMAIAGGIGAIVTGAAIGWTGVGTPAGALAIATGVGMITSAGAGYIVDKKYTGDEFLESYGGQISNHFRDYHDIEDVTDRMNTDIAQYDAILTNTADLINQYSGNNGNNGGFVMPNLNNLSSQNSSTVILNDSSSGASDPNNPQNLENLGFPY